MQSASGETIILGLQVDPGLPTRVAQQLVSSLPGILSRRVSDDVRWDVRLTGGPIPLDEQGTIPVPELAYEAVPGGRVDLTFCLTDLPRRVGAQPIVADASLSPGVALISLPGVGGVRVARRTQELIVYLVGQLAGHRVKRSEDSGQRRSRPRRWAAALGAPIRRGTCPHTNMDVRLITPGLRGRVRLLAGMVRDNRPWRLVPSLADAVAAAVAVASFGLFFRMCGHWRTRCIPGDLD